MTRSRAIHFLASAPVIPVVALAVAACGGGSAATAASPPSPPKTTTTPAPATPAPAHTTAVRVASSRLGRILVDSAGHALYLFKADVGAKSACSGACAAAWPPLLANGKPAAGSGVTASKLGTITRSGGSRQVTYNGHPLYTFIKDGKPGDVSGQGVTAFGAAWFAVSPTGNQISSPPRRHGTGSSSSRTAAPAPAPQTAPPPAAKPAPPPAAKPAPPTATTPASPPAAKSTPQPAPAPAAKPAPPAHNGIPQNGGGDDDSDNHGGPSDGDGNL